MAFFHLSGWSGLSTLRDDQYLFFPMVIDFIAKRQGYKKTSKLYLEVIEKYVEAYEYQYGAIDLEGENPIDEKS